MGEGDPQLGSILMKGFLNALIEQPVLPTHLLFYNSGVKLTTADSGVITSLHALEEGGVEILICGPVSIFMKSGQSSQQEKYPTCLPLPKQWLRLDMLLNHDHMNLYFDNCATSFPKPSAVAEAMSKHLNETGGTYGRSAYPRILNSTRLVEECRDQLAARMGTSEAGKIIFTANATTALNLMIQGICKKGGHVLTSAMEHNAIARPLEHLRQLGLIEWELLDSASDGRILTDRIASKLRPNTILVAVCHMSNVNGIGTITRWDQSSNRGYSAADRCQSVAGIASG